MYCLLPDKTYAEWKSKFDIQACQSDISTILVCCSHVRTLHSQLVPAQVSYEAFWMRYFFKVQQLQKARLSALLCSVVTIVCYVHVVPTGDGESDYCSIRDTGRGGGDFELRLGGGISGAPPSV